MVVRDGGNEAGKQKKRNPKRPDESAEIRDRGVVVTYDNGGGQKGIKKNDSIDQRIKVSAQMLKILDSLGIKPTESEVDDDEL